MHNTEAEEVTYLEQEILDLQNAPREKSRPPSPFEIEEGRGRKTTPKPGGESEGESDMKAREQPSVLSNENGRTSAKEFMSSVLEVSESMAPDALRSPSRCLLFLTQCYKFTFEWNLLTCTMFSVRLHDPVCSGKRKWFSSPYIYDPHLMLQSCR